MPLYVVRRAGFDATAVCRALADPSWLGLETDTPHGSAPVRALLFLVLAGRLIVRVAKRRIGANGRRGRTLAPSSHLMHPTCITADDDTPALRW